MNIEKSDRFKSELKDILDFIALDSVNQALKFYDELILKVLDIPSYPYSYRKRFYNDEKIRELIFKGYTIPFEIDKERNK